MAVSSSDSGSSLAACWLGASVPAETPSGVCSLSSSGPCSTSTSCSLDPNVSPLPANQSRPGRYLRPAGTAASGSAVPGAATAASSRVWSTVSVEERSGTSCRSHMIPNATAISGVA